MAPNCIRTLKRGDITAKGIRNALTCDAPSRNISELKAKLEKKEKNILFASIYENLPENYANL